MLEIFDLKLILGREKFYKTSYTELWIESTADVIHTYF